MTRLFIPIETKVREFHGKLLFALVSAEKGFEVILGHQGELHENIGRWGKGIYVDKSISDTKAEWFRRCHSLGNIMCSWDEEGLVFFNEQMYQRFRVCDEVLKQVRLFFAWGEVEANALKSKLPDVADRIRITGNPRFDLLRPEFRTFYSDAINQRRQKYGRLLLVNTNFAFANFFLGPEGAIKVFNAYRSSEDPGFFSGWTEVQELAYHAFLEIIPYFSRRYSGHTIIIRPHPVENFDPWHKFAREFPNVVVDASGNVHEWILAADAVVHFNCTTGIEAFYLNVPSIAYRKTGSNAFVQPLPNALSIEAFSIDQVLGILDEIIAMNSKYPKLINEDSRLVVAEQNISGMKGPLASERIVDYLSDIDGNEQPPTEDMEPSVPLIKQAWRQVLKVVRRPDQRDIAYSIHKFPGLELDEIQDCVEKFRAISGRFKTVTVQSVRKNCFRLVAN